jgi:hypothetical protein
LLKHREVSLVGCSSFLIVTALVEIGAGLALLVVPSIPFELLLGVSPVAAETLLVGRITGAALLALGVASGLARGDQQGRGLLGLLAAILIYDAAAAVLLGYAALALGMVGEALWPVVVAHTVLAGWCVACFWGPAPKGTAL